MIDCKNTTDDALQNYLTSLKFRQTHFLTDVKLALGYVAVIIAGITFAYDYKLGFEKTRYYTIGTVLVYFLLNGIFTYWTYFVEKDTIFMGEYNGLQVISLRIGLYIWSLIACRCLCPRTLKS